MKDIETSKIAKFQASNNLRQTEPKWLSFTLI